jgi:predicted nucleic acid-binding protein
MATLLVPDASVILKWFLTDEPYADVAIKLYHAYLRGEVNLVLPEYAIYEVSNILTLSRTGYSHGRVKNAIDRLWRMKIPTIHFGIRNIYHALEMLYGYSLQDNFYDVTYLVVAQKYRGKWVTADRRAYDKVRQLPYSMWIQEYA